MVDMVTVHGSSVILIAAKNLARVPMPARSFATLRMTSIFPTRERLRGCDFASHHCLPFGYSIVYMSYELTFSLKLLGESSCD